MTTYSGKPGHEYFNEAHYAQHFESRRIQSMAWNISHGKPQWTEADEMKLVDKLHIEWFDEPFHGNPWTYPELNLDTLPHRPLRRRELAPFKINYETFQEIKLRLNNTVISIKGHAFLVSKIKQYAPGKFVLALTDSLGKLVSVKYDDLQDLRTIPPMYVVSGMTGWLRRVPGRVYQQGINRQNTFLSDVAGRGVVANLDCARLVKNLGTRENRVWNETMSGLVKQGELPVIRLSDDIAVKRDEDNSILACYRGRSLGKILDNEVFVMDEDDLLQGWIERATKEVGLELRA
jgi:hypothetical protein